MNRLKKIFFIFAIVSLLFVFTPVSYALEFTIEGLAGGGSSGAGSDNSLANSLVIGDYTLGQAFDLWNSVTGDNDTLTSYYDFLRQATSNNYTVLGTSSGSTRYLIVVNEKCDIGEYNDDFVFAVNNGSTMYTISLSSGNYKVNYREFNSDMVYTVTYGFPFEGAYLSSNVHIKTITSSVVSSKRYYYWDGSSYAYPEPYISFSPSTPEEPTFPTNEEITNAIQKFYNSDIYKNNKTFKDFVVVYSAVKNTYAFICFERPFTQFIFYDGFEYDGFSSSDTWWKFMFSEDLTSILFRDKFFLYFIEGNSDVITNEGVGFLSDLSELKFSMNMTIVYSTRDYVVVEHRPPAEGETENQITTGTIEGDSYTYDESLNPTDSQYSPLENNVSSSPTESILNNVDFDSINKAFEDGKVILNIENATWLFTANNQLVDYFVGFITFIIILLVISRVLGG